MQVFVSPLLIMAQKWIYIYLFTVCIMTSSFVYVTIYSIYKPLGGKIRFRYDGVGTSNNNEITIVTAFFEIGEFKKGNAGSSHFNKENYFKWALSFRSLMNPVIVYTDSEEFEVLMNQIRNKIQSKTKILKIQRNSSWAFNLLEEVRDVFSQKDYPKFHPNTVVPEYACAQFAKYDVTERAMQENCFGTNFFAWLDVGYFREFSTSRKPYRLSLPKDFKEETVAMTRIKTVILNSNMSDIVKFNSVWVGGGLFLGQRQVLLNFAQQMRTAVNYFLARKIISTDQQVLYGLYSTEGRRDIKPRVELQLYHSRIKDGDWTLLGRRMMQFQCGLKLQRFCSSGCRECTFSLSNSSKSLS